MTAKRLKHKGHMYVLAQDPPEEEEAAGEEATEEAEGEEAAEEDKGEEVAEEPETEEEEVGAPDAAEMVKEIEEQPVSEWRNYLQPIIRILKQQLGGVPVSLVSPQVSTDFISPQFGFYIEGYVEFPDGTPEDILEEFGDVPIQFTAYVDPDGKLTQPVETFTEVIEQK